MREEVPVVQVTEFLPTSPSGAWACITQPKHMKHWFFEQMPDFKSSPGFQTAFTMKSDTREFHAIWKVLEVEPQKRLVVAWTYEGIPGEGRVCYSLSPEAKGTRLDIRNEGLGSFPQDIPEFHYESCRNGWLYFIERLRSYILDNKALSG
jgi:uncharacterized protein YndB with AHSA1/START domain